MNYRMIAYFVGQIIRVDGLLMLCPFICTLVYGEYDEIPAFLIPIAACLLFGTLLTFLKPKNTDIFAKEGLVTVGLSWIILSAIGAVPFVVSGSIPSFIDAFFETVSGFTTSGGSILTDVEALSHGMLFWRSFTHWVGGMGVLVFILAFLPQADTKSVKLMHVMRAEVPGPKVGKLVSKIARTARITYGLYVVLTVIEFVMLLCGGMPVFDSLANSFATAGTGGFALKNAGIAAYGSPYIEYVIGVFMLLFGINFNLFYLMSIGHFGQALKSEELHVYLGLIAISTGVIAYDIYGIVGNVADSVRTSFFQVSSIVTTTGFSTADFNTWPALSKTILVLLMFVGGCVGSTGGGLKVGRVLLLIKTAHREIKYALHPRAVVPVRLEKKQVEPDVIRGTCSYFLVYVFIFVASFFAIELLNECDLITGFTAVSACINNIGPGLGVVGPCGNFSSLTQISKLILSFDMLAGRLEIFPILILFAPSTWKNR